ncbi:MAG: LPP20 family lipoprotein [Helicobacteraceae bacterium]|jgi:hypothetical protein|nr:LPP20 family lipoprotein [Helicobacteraceae bacterium]
MRLYVLLLLTLAGCASQPAPQSKAPPEWVLSSGGSYPIGSYLTGLGSGANQTIAADRARSELVKIISVTVESASSARTAMDADGYRSDFASRVFARSTQTIEGVEIAERWYDEANDLYYALAVLDRQRAASRLRSIVAHNDLEIDNLEQEALKQGDLARLKLISSALELLKERVISVAVLSVLDDRAVISSSKALRLNALKRETIGNLTFGVIGDTEAVRVFSSALGAEGFAIATDSNYDYEARVSFNINVRDQNGWKWANAVLDAQITDRRNRTMHSSFRFEARESSQDTATAKARALKKLQRELHDKLLSSIVSSDGLR